MWNLYIFFPFNFFLRKQESCLQMLLYFLAVSWIRVFEEKAFFKCTPRRDYDIFLFVKSRHSFKDFCYTYPAICFLLFAFFWYRLLSCCATLELHFTIDHLPLPWFIAMDLWLRYLNNFTIYSVRDRSYQVKCYTSLISVKRTPFVWNLSVL